MALYSYRGFDESGKPIQGMREAEQSKLLRTILRKEGILVTEVSVVQGEESGKKEEEKQISLTKWIEQAKDTVTPVQGLVVQMTRQLGVLLKSGVQLSEALGILTEQAERVGFKKLMSDIRLQVNEGKPISEAMKAYPRYFDDLYISMVAVGESAGNLDVILLRLAEFLENQNKIKNKIISAMLYPLFIFVFAIAVVALLMVVLVPQLQLMYNDAGQTLPWNTKVIIFLSDYYWLILPAIVGCIFLFIYWKKTEAGKKIWDRITLRLWVIGPLKRTVAVSRFTKTLATLLGSGIQLLKAMEIARNVLGNSILAQAVETAQLSIREGESIAQPLKRSGQFPSLVSHMITVGERSGQLETMLESVASSYSVEVEQKIAALMSLLEPLTILFMGGLVGFIVYSVMSPLLGASQLNF